MTGGHGEVWDYIVWDYIMDTREELSGALARIMALEERVGELQARLHDHEQAVPHAEAMS